MKKTVTKTDFIKEFEGIDNFTRKGLIKLFNYFEELEEQIDEEIILDPIAICCMYNEYGNIEELKQDYNLPEGLEQIKEFLDNRTEIVSFEDDCIIIQAF